MENRSLKGNSNPDIQVSQGQFKRLNSEKLKQLNDLTQTKDVVPEINIIDIKEEKFASKEVSPFFADVN
jgi:hypothetical protein